MWRAYFVTGFYPDSQEAIVKMFTDNYMKAYAIKPDLLAAQILERPAFCLRP